VRLTIKLVERIADDLRDPAVVDEVSDAVVAGTITVE
jgi:hypothetical protein